MTSLARGLEVLCLFEGHAALTVTQAAKRTGLSRSSVARCLFTLGAALGYVAGDGPAYRLRPALLPLACALLRIPTRSRMPASRSSRRCATG